MSDLDLEDRTQSHYNDYPFDFLAPKDEENIDAFQPPAFRRFTDEFLEAKMEVADIGCGPGRATLFMIQLGMRVTAVDISQKSLDLTRRRAPDCKTVRASNLNLPFPDAYFDAVVSDGVIHHTPDAHRSFVENARILKPGGTIYIGVYRRYRYYYYLYTYAGVPIRWLEQRRWGKALIHLTILPLYYLIHLAKSRGKRTWKGARNFFYDYIITPRASFHRRDEIEAWGGEAGLELLWYEPNVGNVHAFAFRKRRPNDGSRHV